MFTVWESFCWLTDRVRTLLFLQAAGVFTAWESTGVFSFLDNNRLVVLYD